MSAVRPAIGEHEAADISHSVTNSVIQAVAKELLKQGLRGGLGDDRPLRDVVYRMALARFTETLKANLTSGQISDPAVFGGAP